MAYKIKQFRYYSDDSPLNKPAIFKGKIISTNNYASNEPNNNIFSNYYPIYQLGIQTLPGTKFYLNDNLEEVMIGSTGIYELDLGLNTKLTKIRFNSQSMETIKNNENAYLIIDFLYDDKQKENSNIEEV